MSPIARSGQLGKGGDTMTDERKDDIDLPEGSETYGQGRGADEEQAGIEGGTGSTSGTGAGGGGMGSGIGQTGDQGLTPGMGTGEADTSLGTDAGTGDVGEGPGGEGRNPEQDGR
jgi:hypothetical protein